MNVHNKKNLETIHKQNVRKMQEYENKLDSKKKELQFLQQHKNTDNVDKIRKLKDEIFYLEEEDPMKDYHLKTAEIMNQYYNVSHKKEETKNILDLFNKSEDKEDDDEIIRSCDFSEMGPGGLFNAYISKIDPDFTTVKKTARGSNNNKNNVLKCKACKSKDVAEMYTEGYIICMHCNYVEKIIVDHDKPSYKDPPKEVSYNCYKRSTHLNECINQIQGKESTDIPDDVFDKIVFELKKQRITNMNKLDINIMFKLLKKLNLSRYYDHIPYIIYVLNGKKNPVIDPKVEEKLHDMFRQVHELYNKHVPLERKNMLSYPYLLYKFFELLEQDHILKNVRLLKNAEKRKEQDEVWKNICNDCKWQFIPTTLN